MKRISKNKAVELVKRGALLVDMRSPVSFRDGHVPGAVNLPLRNFVNRIMPMDKKTKIIIYSDTVADDVLRQGNTYANGLGFMEVFISDYRSLTEDSNEATRTRIDTKGKAGRKRPQRNTEVPVSLRGRNHN